MEDSVLCLDVYSDIFRHLSWGTLQQIHRVNRFFSWLADKEIARRWTSEAPLGDPHAKFVIITEHIYLETIFCRTGDSTVWIDPRDWSKTWFADFFENYFHYSLTQQRYIMTNTLFRQLIRNINHKSSLRADPINEFRQTMVFTNSLELETFY